MDDTYLPPDSRLRDPSDMKKEEIQIHLSFWRERQASEPTSATIFRFKMSCTGRASGDLQPARYLDSLTHTIPAPNMTTTKRRKKGQSHKAPATSTPALGIQPVTAEALATTAGDLQQNVMFQFDLTANNTEAANMANDTTLLNINMGLNVPISTPSGLFLPDDMCLGGPIEDGIGSLQLDDDLLPYWDQGFSFGAQTFSPGPLMSNLSGGPSNLGSLLEGALDNPATAGALSCAGDGYSAGPRHTENSVGYSHNSPGQLLGVVQVIGNILGGPLPAGVTNESEGPPEGIRNIQSAPSPAGATYDPGRPGITGTKRKAADSKNDQLPRKKGRPAMNLNVAMHSNPGPAGQEALTIPRSCRERKATAKVATKLAEEAATKAAREAAKEAKAAKGKGKTQTRGSGRK